MKKIRILQIKHRLDSISTNLTCEIAKGFSNSDTYDFCYGVLSASQEEMTQCDIPCAKINFELDEHDVVKCTPHARQVLSSHIRDAGYDIIITHRYKPARLLSSIASQLECKAFVSVWHGLGELDSIGRQWLARRRMQDRWHHVGVSGAVTQDLLRRLPQGANIHIIHNGINIGEIHQNAMTRAEARTVLNLPADSLVLGTIGRAVPVKGHKDLIAAFPHIREQFSQSKLLIIGGGRLENRLRAQCKSLGISADVIITGNIDDASRYLPAVDLFLMPSLSEGLSLAVLEAMSFGIPVLASSVGGLPEALGPSGRFFPARSPESIARAVVDFLNSGPEAHAEYSRYLRHYVNEQFSVMRYQERYRRFIEAILD